MNFFNYLFENTHNLDKKLVLNSHDKPASYSEIYSDCLSISSYLRLQFGTGQKVILMSSNSVFFIKVYFSIIKSGNICIPVSPEIEKENLDYIIQKCTPKIIFVSNRYLHRFSNCINVVNETSLEYNISPQYRGVRLNEENFDSSNLAEIIFTSGSTGRPKGVMITHKNLIANTSSIISYLQLDNKDIMQVVLPFHYCYGLSLLHTHVRVGGSLVLTNSFMFLGTVIKDLIEFKCTGFAGVPSHFQILLRKTKEFKNMGLPNLRYVTQAGGKLNTTFIEEFVQAFPNVRFFTMYGQTEATARLSFLPPEHLKEKMGSIGKGIPGVELKVVNKSGNPVKEGETGEVIARGDNIMLGYLDDEEATREAIRDSWLYTDDLATVDKDGYIYIIGRKSDVLKIRGNRISSKEIEDVILQIPSVILCVVKGISVDGVCETIKAEVVVRNKCEVTERQIQEYCSQRLAHYKIPGIIEIKTDHEMNLSGKKIIAV